MGADVGWPQFGGSAVVMGPPPITSFRDGTSLTIFQCFSGPLESCVPARLPFFPYFRIGMAQRGPARMVGFHDISPDA